MILMNLTSVLKVDVVMKCSWSFSTLISAISGLFSSISIFTPLVILFTFEYQQREFEEFEDVFARRDGIPKKIFLCFTHCFVDI